MSLLSRFTILLLWLLLRFTVLSFVLLSILLIDDIEASFEALLKLHFRLFDLKKLPNSSSLRNQELV